MVTKNTHTKNINFLIKQNVAPLGEGNGVKTA